MKAAAVDVEGVGEEVLVVQEVTAVHSTNTARPAKCEYHFSSALFYSSYHPISDTEKRVHQSWGGDDGPTELKDETAAVTDAAADSNDWGVAATDAPADDPWGAPIAADAFAPTEPERERGEGRPRREREPREPEEEDNTLTLEQYLAQKQESTVIPKLEAVRKANEGADDNIWKDAVPIQKNEEEDAYFVGKVHHLVSPF